MRYTCVPLAALTLLLLAPAARGDDAEWSEWSLFAETHREISLGFGPEFILGGDAGGASNSIDFDELFGDGKTIHLNFNGVFGPLLLGASYSYHRYEGRTATYNIPTANGANSPTISETPDDWDRNDFRVKLGFQIGAGRWVVAEEGFELEEKPLAFAFTFFFALQGGVAFSESLSSNVSGVRPSNFPAQRLKRYNRSAREIYGFVTGLKGFFGESAFVGLSFDFTILKQPRLERNPVDGMGALANALPAGTLGVGLSGPDDLIAGAALLEIGLSF